MKKVISIIMAALMSAASLAQVKVSHSSVNPKMSALFDELTQLGRAPMVTKRGGMEQWGNLPHLEYTVRLWLRPDLWYSRQRKEEPRVLDSLLRAEKTSFEKQVKAIRRTLNKLAKEAQDKSLYYNQKSGKDTIYYALNLSHDTTRVYKLQEGNHTYYNSDEFLDFVLESGKQEGTFEGYLNYTVSLPRVNPGATSDLYSWHSLKEDIARLMDEHGVGHRDALWQHDMAYSDSIWEEEHSEWFSKGWAGDHNSAGLTEATIYSVPEANKPLADRLLAKTDSLAQKYTDQLQGYYYQYNYGVSFDGFTPELIRTSAPGTPSGNSIYIQHADGGYHFLVLQTRGVEWIPTEWYSLKSFVNGKKTYFEGMAPKE